MLFMDPTTLGILGAALGALIAAHRERAQLTQGGLAERAHIAQSTLSRIERGHVAPDYPTLRRLSMALFETKLRDDLLKLAHLLCRSAPSPGTRSRWARGPGPGLRCAQGGRRGRASG